MSIRTPLQTRSPEIVSRFAGVSRLAAAGVLIAVAALIAFSLPQTRSAPPAHKPPAAALDHTDIGLYRAIVARVRAGQPYEVAALTEQRAGGFQRRPFLVVRPPALALILARLPDEKTAYGVLDLLTLAVIGAWAWRLRALWPGGALFAALVVFTGASWALDTQGIIYYHEVWSGLLIALSLALRGDRRFVAAVVLGLAAALIRELALPYLLVMSLFALFERRRAEAAAFTAALVIALGALALHAHAVTALVSPNEPASPGWVKLGGWVFVLSTVQNFVVLITGPWMAALLLPLALLGAVGWKGPTGSRLAALLIGYSLGFMLIGRPTNNYWGILTTPLTAVGLCCAPMALRDLFRRLKVKGARDSSTGSPQSGPVSFEAPMSPAPQDSEIGLATKP